jgi:hypothetical protein
MLPGVGMVGGAGRRGNGGNNGLLGPGLNQGPGFGRRQGPTNPNQEMPQGYFDPNTGQFIQLSPTMTTVPAQGTGPAQGQVTTQTRVYDKNNRIFIQETGQYTGEMYDPATGRIYIPEPATQAASTSAEAGQKPAPPVDPPKPLGPPKNALTERLEAAAGAIRRRVRTLIQSTAYQRFLEDELEEVIRPVKFSDADRDQLLGLAERKDSVTPEKIELLAIAVDEFNAEAVRRKLDDMQVGQEQYRGLIEKIAVNKEYRDLCAADLQTPLKTRQAILRLEKAATKAGLPPIVLRSVKQKLEAFARIYEELDESDPERVELKSITPDSSFTVVRWRGYPSSTPALLASDTLLLPGGKGSGGNKLTIETATAAQVGLPIYGSLNSPLPDIGADVSAAALGVSFRVDPQAGFELTIAVTDESERGSSPYTLKPGVPLAFPTRQSVQLAFLDGRGGWTAFERVEAGSYVFSVRNGAWQKALESSTVVLDNTANSNPFNYSIGGADSFVPARQTVTLNLTASSTLIKFHRGVGDREAAKVLSAGKPRVVVRVAGDGGLDLFEPDAGDGIVLVDGSSVPADTASAPEDTLQEIRPRFPVGNLDE